MRRVGSFLVRIVRSDIGRVFTRSITRSYGVVKDIHFASLTFGTARESGFWMAPGIAFLAALTFFGTSSLLHSRLIPRLTERWSDRLFGLFAERLPRVFPRRAGTYLYLRPLPERPRPTAGFQAPQRVAAVNPPAPRPPGHND